MLSCVVVTAKYGHHVDTPPPRHQLTTCDTRRFGDDSLLWETIHLRFINTSSSLKKDGPNPIGDDLHTFECATNNISLVNKRNELK